MTSKRNQAYERQNERAPYQPAKRIDGQLYPPPSMDAFSKEWEEGYDDGFQNRDRKAQPNLNLQQTYDDGFDIGVAEKEEVNRAGSSNT